LERSSVGWARPLPFSGNPSFSPHSPPSTRGCSIGEMNYKSMRKCWVNFFFLLPFFPLLLREIFPLLAPRRQMWISRACFSPLFFKKFFPPSSFLLAQPFEMRTTEGRTRAGFFFLPLFPSSPFPLPPSEYRRVRISDDIFDNSIAALFPLPFFPCF